MPKPLDRRIRNREYDARRRTEKPWRAMYQTKAWRERRAAQLRLQPLCERCLARGVIEPATVAHHVERHEGDPVKFYRGDLQSVCSPCHDIDAQREEKGGQVRQFIGADGWPL